VQHNHLLGGKSQERYNEYIRKRNVLQNHAVHTSTDGDAQFKTTMRKIVSSDIDYGKIAVATVIQKGPLTHEVIAKVSAVTPEWTQLFRPIQETSGGVSEIELRYGATFVTRLKNVCRLEALVAVAEWIRTGLSARLHMNEYSDWLNIAPALAGFVETVQRTSVDDSLLTGLWR
jgi:hypothetical protein